MRTTVEMKPEHRAALVALAAERGEKGFSGILEEAIEVYLAGKDERERKKKALLSCLGSISEEEGERMHAVVRELRANWR